MTITSLVLQAGQFATAAVAGRVADSCAAARVLEPILSEESQTLYRYDTANHDCFADRDARIPEGALILIEIDHPFRWDQDAYHVRCFGTLSEEKDPSSL